MDYQKCGEFLTILRKSKGLTQQELAEKLNYSDKTISRWERGIAFPTDISVLKVLSKVLDVSIEELMYGERKTKENSKNVDNIIVKEYEKQNKSLKKSKFKNKLFLVGGILLIVVSIFLILFFGFYRNSIKIYKLTINDNDNILTNNSFILIKTKNEAFLNFNKLEITDDDEINYVRLYYVENNKEHEIVSFSNDNLFLTEVKGYNEYNLNELDGKLIKIEIAFNDKKVTYDIIKTLLYTNSKLFPSKKEPISEDTSLPQEVNQDYIKFLKQEGFKETSLNYFSYADDEKEFDVHLETRSIEITVCNDYICTYIYKILGAKDLVVIDYNNLDNSKDYSNITKEKNCKNESCTTIEEYVMYVNYLENNY